MGDDAARIRDALRDPEALCDALGLTGEGLGRTWFRDGFNRVRVPCPWHPERTGSCSVSLGADGTVRVRCFGCDATGDALSLVAAALSLDARRDFGRVLAAAAQIAGVEGPRSALPFPRRAPVAVARPVSPPVETPIEGGEGSVDLVVAALRELAPVTSSSRAMQYLRSRGIAQGAALGWIALPSTVAELDALRRLVVERVGVEAWSACGLAMPSGAFKSLWRDRVVTPWEAPNGVAETMVGRAMGDDEPRYAGLPGRRPRWPWGVADLVELAGPRTAVAFVEGAIDAVSFNLLAQRRDGDVIALGIPGVSNWLPEWAALARGRHAVVALDGDKAGQSAIDRVSKSLRGIALSVTPVAPARGKDWNDTLRQQA